MEGDGSDAAALLAWHNRVRDIDRRNALIASRRALLRADVERAAEARQVVEILAKLLEDP